MRPSVSVVTFLGVRRLLRAGPSAIHHAHRGVPAVLAPPGFHGAGHAQPRVQRAVLPHLSHLVARHRRLRRGAAASSPAPAQQAQEGLSEVRVERIDDRVEGRIAPADPHEDVERFLADAVGAPPDVQRPWSWTEGQSAVQDKEWQPAADKHTHDDAQSFEDFCLLSDGDFKFSVWGKNRLPRVWMKMDIRLV